MKKYLVIASVMVMLASTAVAQSKVFSSAPNQSSMPVKQIEASIDFLQREYDRIRRQLKQMDPFINGVSGCQAANMIYAPGAAMPATGVVAGCVSTAGTPFVSEIKVASGTDDGLMGSSGSATDRMQSFIEASCPAADGWHPCSDDEVVFALDQQVIGANPPSLLLDSSTYWVRSVNPFRFAQTAVAASASLVSLNCSGWSSAVAPSLSPAERVGTMFSGAPSKPVFNFGNCNVARKVLCCR